MHRQIHREGKWAVGKGEEKGGCVGKGNGRVEREERREGCVRKGNWRVGKGGEKRRMCREENGRLKREEREERMCLEG
jgi:hypothetical protein